MSNVRVFKTPGSSFSFLQKTGLYVLIFALLLPVAFYALFLDHGVFVRGAQVLLKGRQLYGDYLDMKPPVIFYLYGICEFFFPSSERALKVFDLLWQFATALSIVYAVKKIYSEKAAFAATIIYSISYSVLYFTGTMQCESFAAMPMIWLLYLHCQDAAGKNRERVLSGILIGILIGLKFTLGIMLVALICEDILSRRYDLLSFFKKYAVIATAMILSLCVIFYFLFDPIVRSEYSRLAQYISAYASFPPIDSAFVERAYEKQFELFFKEYSFTFFLFAVVSVGVFFKNSRIDTQQNTLVLTSILACMLLWCTVILERKFFPYHFSRIYVPMAILSGVGATVLFKKMRLWWQADGFKSRTILGFSIVFFIAVSPLFRWALYARTPYYFYTDSARYNNLFQKGNPDQPLSVRQQHLNIAGEIASVRSAGERVFVVGMEAARLGYFLKEFPISKFSTSQYYLGNGSPQKWKDEAFKEIEKSTWLIVQTDDSQPLIFGHAMSSWEAARYDPRLGEYIRNNFAAFKTIGYYHIFKRK